jgi:DNA-binding transcriptional LysR family regulator
MHIDLRQLRHFIALAEQRSFVAGGIGREPVAIGVQPQHPGLEHSVGCQLVDRGRKELPPTKQGQAVGTCAAPGQRGAAMANEISQFNGLEAGELRFGCGPAPAAGLIPRDRRVHRALPESAGAISGR